MNNFQENLQSVFDLCKPRRNDKKISLSSLKALLQGFNHETSFEELFITSITLQNSFSQDWISFDEFCRGVDKLAEDLTSSTTSFHPQHPFREEPTPNHQRDESELNLIRFEEAEPPWTGSADDKSHPPNKKEETTLLDKFLQSSPLESWILEEPPISPTSSSSVTSNSSSTMMSESINANNMSPIEAEPDNNNDLGINSHNDRSQCSSSSMSDERDLLTEENFESFGDNEEVEYDSELVDYDHDCVDFQSSDKAASPANSNRKNNKNFVRRNAWMRTSLRRTSSGATHQNDTNPPKRWGSFRYPSKRIGSHAIASQLYHNGTSSFNSSGRSSNCDDGEMQSDISLEEDVTDLNQKVQMLTAKVDVLTDSQAITDDKYSKVKQENASLTSRINELEEEVRELQIQSREQIEQEQKRSREMIARVEREKQLEIENYSIKLQSLEKENSVLETEVNNLKQELERIKVVKRSAEESLQEAQLSLAVLKDENDQLREENIKTKEESDKERVASRQLIEDLSKEVEIYRQQSSAHLRTSPLQTVHSIEEDERSMTLTRMADLENELRVARDQLRTMSVKNDELEGQLLQRGVEQGQMLISSVPSEGDTSLRNELENLSDNQDLEGTKAELNEVRTALKDQQEVNFQLRHYIDSILMNIMEKYPELLEVRK